MLKELCSLIADCPHSTPRWTEKGVLVLRSQNIRGGKLNFAARSYTDEAHYRSRIRRAEPRQNDIVITREAPMGEVCMIPTGLKCCLGQRMVLLRPDPAKVSPRFLLYALQSSKVQAAIKAHEGTGSTVSNLRIPLLEALKIDLPERNDQDDAAAILGALDDRIELFQNSNETLEAMARAIFKSWFVDFDPVRAKSEGREPEGMDAAIATLFPSEFQGCELGPIPCGWRLGQLSDIVAVSPSRTLRKGEPALYLDMANVPTVGPSASDIVERPLGSGCKFVNGDTLFAKITPCLENGKTAFVDFLQPNEVGWGSTELIVFAPISPAPPVLGYLLARDTNFRSFAEQNMTGTSGRQRVPPDQLKRFRVVIADEAVYRSFDAIVTPMFDSITANANRMRTLASLRDTLLPRLISGKLRTSEAEAMLVEAL